MTDYDFEETCEEALMSKRVAVIYGLIWLGVLAFALAKLSGRL